MEALRDAVQQEHREAQWWLGKLLMRGDHVEENAVEAVKLFRRAADSGFAPAQLELGKCYLTGQVVQKDIQEASALIRRASHQEPAETMMLLEVIEEYQQAQSRKSKQ